MSLDRTPCCILAADSAPNRRQDRRHTLQYDLAWRTLNDDTMRASPSVRDQLGESLKSALTYTFRTGAFDDPTFPLSGYGLRWGSALHACPTHSTVQKCSSLEEGRVGVGLMSMTVPISLGTL